MDKIKILVVDDESRMRKLVKDFLEREGYQVIEAGDGMEAMEQFYDEKDIALIILDGVPGTAMPPWRPLLSEDDALWIADYLKGVTP